MAQDPFAAIAEPATQGDPFAAIAEPAQGGGTPPPEQTPGFFKRLFSGYDPGAQEYAEKHPVLGVPVRALSAAGGALLGTAPAVYHAFADPATEEEKARYAEGEKARGEAPGTETSGLKRVGLGVRRLTIDPVAEAAKDYAAGKVTLGGALSVAPEALGTAVGSVAGSEVTGRLGQGASRVVTAPAETALNVAQKGAAAAINPVLEKVGVQARVPTPEPGGTVQPFARKVTGVESSVKDAVKAAGAEQATALEENKAARTETVKANLEKQRQANYDIERTKLSVAEKNKAIEAENKAQAEAAAQREELTRTVDQQSADLGKKIESVESRVGKEADSKFDSVRELVGNPEADPAPLTAAVRTAEAEDLQGIPENIKEFREIVKHGQDIAEDAGLADAARRHAGDPGQLGEDAAAALEGPEPMTWNKLQSLKSRIDTRLRQARTRPLNGDVKRALYRVQNQIVDTMGDMAEEAGAGDAWADARNFYRQYKEDFYEPHGPSGSGSPVAQAFNAVDPAKIRQPFLGTARSTLGNRAIDILRKYPQFGGEEAAGLADQMVQNHQTAQGLPKEARPAELKVAPTAIDLPVNKPAPPVPAAPPVDIHQVALDAIEKRSRNWGQFNARDVGILASSAVGGLTSVAFGHNLYGGAIAGVIGYEAGKYSLSRITNSPAVIEWLAKTPQPEIDVIRKIPNADKVKILDGITQVAVQAGNKTRLSPQAAALIGPENVHKIIMAGGAIHGAQIQNRKDALKALGREPVPTQ